MVFAKFKLSQNHFKIFLSEPFLALESLFFALFLLFGATGFGNFILNCLSVVPTQMPSGIRVGQLSSSELTRECAVLCGYRENVQWGTNTMILADVACNYHGQILT